MSIDHFLYKQSAGTTSATCPGFTSNFIDRPRCFRSNKFLNAILRNTKTGAYQRLFTGKFFDQPFTMAIEGLARCLNDGRKTTFPASLTLVSGHVAGLMIHDRLLT